MYSIFVSLVAGMIAGGGLQLLLKAHGWGLGWVVLVFIAVYLACMLLINRQSGQQLKALVERVQAKLQEMQEELTKQSNRFRNHPVSPKVMEEQLEKTVERGVEQALAVLDEATPLYKWNILAERQVITLRAQLYYQIKRFEDVDKLMPKVMILEPQVVAMKLAREYQNNVTDLEKTYKQGLSKFKLDKATIIYATYAWILLKRNETEKALAVLVEAKDKTENPVLAANWQHVANGKPQLFNNSGLGEAWYGLHLERPPMQRVSKGDFKRHPLMGKGKRRYF